MGCVGHKINISAKSNKLHMLITVYYSFLCKTKPKTVVTVVKQYQVRKLKMKRYAVIGSVHLEKKNAKMTASLLVVYNGKRFLEVEIFLSMHVSTPVYK